MRFQKIQGILDEALKNHQVPCSDIIISKDNEIIYRYMNGTKDPEKSKPIAGDELYFLYSATKPITCTAALQLIEQGKLGLEDYVHEYIPAFQHVKVQTEQGLVPVKNPITIRHLFTMTSGMDYNWPNDALRRQLITDTQSCTLDLVKAMASSPLHFEPGTHFLYSLSHDVLAAIIEIVSGISYGEYLQKHIFDVCDMKNTHVGAPAHIKDRICSQYRYDSTCKCVVLTEKENNLIFAPKYQSGGAGVVSCVDDYIKFAQNIVSGERLLKRDTVELWRTGQLSGDALSDFHAICPGYTYGLGVRVNPSNEFSTKGEFGWDGAAGAYVLFDPDNHLALFYATHVKDYGDYLYRVLHPMIRDAVYEEL